MWSVSTSVALLGAFGLFLLSTANVSEKYQHFAPLDELGSYKLYWSVDRKHESIYFAVEVRTTGWIGFGISTGNGKMKGSDLVIGWVKDCKGYLTVRNCWKPLLHARFAEKAETARLLTFCN